MQNTTYVATALSAVLFYLYRYLHILETAKSEIRTIFNSLAEIRSSPKMDSCTFLNACIEEGLRLSPPVATSLPREVMKGGIVVDSHYIPEGTVIGVSAYVVHHNEEAFPEHWSFRPERWIVGSDFHADGVGVLKADINRGCQAMCPFSLGNRSCIGKTLHTWRCKYPLRCYFGLMIWKKSRVLEQNIVAPMASRQGEEGSMSSGLGLFWS